MNVLVGKKVSSRKQVTEELVRIFAEISGDKNPIHLDEKYASQTRFKKRIAHGLYVSSFISALIANELPGAGTIYLDQSLSFKKPVYLGDWINTTVEVLEINEKGIAKLRTICLNDASDIVIEGFALVKVP